MSPVLQSKLRVLRAIRHKAGDALCEADYRAILKRCAGVESSTEIRSLAKADAVLAEFARLGLGTLPKRQPADRAAEEDVVALAATGRGGADQ
jgi:hypothetical protein